MPHPRGKNIYEKNFYHVSSATNYPEYPISRVKNKWIFIDDNVKKINYVSNVQYIFISYELFSDI